MGRRPERGTDTRLGQRPKRSGVIFAVSSSRDPRRKGPKEGEGKWAGPALGGTQPTLGPGSSQKKIISIRPPENHTPTMGVQRPGNCFWGAHVPILHVIQAT